MDSYFDSQSRRPNEADTRVDTISATHGINHSPSRNPNSSAGNMAESTSPRRRNDESWVEIASQPSSSSLSSIGDEIVTTGLRVHRRRNPLQSRHGDQSTMPQSYLVDRSAARGNTSSHEDMGETESESDTSPLHLGSRLRAVVNAEPLSGYDNDDDDDDDDESGDENATALGRPAPAFRPQPNAFSHPPSHLTHRHSTPSYPHERVSSYRSRRSSYSRGSQHRPNFMSPSYRDDNDAALRASLTTLLSCAAAARALPKRNEPDSVAAAGPSSNAAALQPMGLRLVPEAELMGPGPDVSPRTTSPPEPKAQPQASAAVTRTPSSTSERSLDKVSKRSQKSASGSGRAIKKKRMAEATELSLSTTYITPTLMTWVFSAGVVVLVSVVGFGAGYVIGREVGRQEGAGSIVGSVGGGNATSSCGREIVKGGTLRRFRWGSVGKSVVA